MTPSEIQILICGLLIGAQATAVLVSWWSWRDTRVHLEASRQARRRAAGDHYLNSLRLYQIQQRAGVRR